MAFNPQAGQTVTIRDTIYQIAEHPAAPDFPFGQEGRAGIVYQLVGESEPIALKVFKPRFVTPDLVSLADQIESFAVIPGLSVCHRKVLTPQQDASLLRQAPELTYAVLMPWITGPSWMQILLDKPSFTPQQSLSLAQALTQMLSIMEQKGIAHCDLSAANLLFPSLAGTATQESFSPVELVDVEQIYARNLNRPEMIPSGSDGYAHKSVRTERMWNVKADRFAGAVLLAEILSWCEPIIQDAAWGESFFDQHELQQSCDRYHLLHQTLGRAWGAHVAGLFQRAWHADLLDDCPTFGEWLIALPVDVECAVQARGETVDVQFSPNSERKNVPAQPNEYSKSIEADPEKSSSEERVCESCEQTIPAGKTDCPHCGQALAESVSEKRGNQRFFFGMAITGILTTILIFIFTLFKLYSNANPGTYLEVSPTMGTTEQQQGAGLVTVDTYATMTQTYPIAPTQHPTQTPSNEVTIIPERIMTPLSDLKTFSLETTNKFTDISPAGTLISYIPDVSDISFVSAQVAMANGHYIEIYSLPDAQKLYTLEIGAYTTALTFYNQGKNLATINGKTLQLWDMTENPPISLRQITLNNINGAITTVAISPDARYLAAAVKSGVMVIDISQEDGRQVFRNDAYNTKEIVFSPDMRFMMIISEPTCDSWHWIEWEGTWTWSCASVSGNDNLGIYSINRYTGNMSLIDVDIPAGSLTFDTRGSKLYVNNGDNTQIWSLDTLSKEREIPTGPLFNIALSPDETVLIGNDSENILRVVDTSSGMEVHRYEAYSFEGFLDSGQTILTSRGATLFLITQPE
jgi:hypothetical protein